MSVGMGIVGWVVLGLVGTVIMFRLTRKRDGPLDAHGVATGLGLGIIAGPISLFYCLCFIVGILVERSSLGRRGA